MKTWLLIFILITLNFAFADPENGDWTEQNVTLFSTTEADVMVRAGDIDNLGFGWAVGYDPFSGNTSGYHSYPWTADTLDVDGTDRIMVISSYNGSPPHGRDGYTSGTSRPENLPRPITIHYDLLGTAVYGAALQIFVDDFQAPVWWADYEVYMNGVQAPFLETIINALSQTGPVGKLISTQIPPEFLYLLESDSLGILFDDNVTGAGDGYAVDFIKLLINPVGYSYTGTIHGTVYDNDTNALLEGVTVTASNTISEVTGVSGTYNLEYIPAGYVFLEAVKPNYVTYSTFINLADGADELQDIYLQPRPDVPLNVTITETGGFIEVSWDAVIDITSYTVYSSLEAYADESSWTLELSGITDLLWTETATDVKKFYFVRSVE